MKKLQFNKNMFTIKQLLQLNLHVGCHKKLSVSNINKQVLLGYKNKISIINLEYTIFNLKKTLYILAQVFKVNCKLLTINENEEFKNVVTHFKNVTKQFCILDKYLGGLLTNYEELIDLKQKKIKNNQILGKLKILDESYYTEFPRFVLICSSRGNRESILSETQRLFIPTASVIDTNKSDVCLNYINYPIFINEQSIDSIFLILNSIIKLQQRIITFKTSNYGTFTNVYIKCFRFIRKNCLRRFRRYELSLIINFFKTVFLNHLYIKKTDKSKNYIKFRHKQTKSNDI
jgi:ribosomal protein S2